ncbi:hypothetical protein [Streptomyces sp. MMS24-I29]
MRLFGITEKTAMRYVTAAHPERTAKLCPGDASSEAARLQRTRDEPRGLR